MERDIDIRVSLPESLLSELDGMARQRGTSRGRLLREALRGYLKSAVREGVEKRMEEYVRDLADGSREFVRETEDHTVERILKHTDW